MALLKEKQENFNDAKKILLKIIEIDSSFSPAYNALGMINDRKEDYGEAFDNFSRAIELDSDNAVFFHNRGCCLKNMGRYEESIADFI